MGTKKRTRMLVNSTDPQASARRAVISEACSELFDSQLLGHALSGPGWEFRERVLTPEVMLGAMLHFVLSPFESLLALMDALRAGEVLGDREIRFSSTAFYNRLRTVPHDVYLAVLREATAEIRRRGVQRNRELRKLAPMANGIFAIDDTTLDALMRRTTALAKHEKGSAETLAGRLGCALDVTTGLLAEVMYDEDALANEKNHFWPIVERLGSGNLLIFDLGYFSFPLFDQITKSFNWFICPLRKRTSYKVAAKGVQTDLYRESIIELGAHTSDRAEHPVRLVELKIGKTWYPYITNMTDPRQLSAHAIWRLYQERWSIEQAFATIKRAIGAAYLHPCHTNGVLAQVWSTLAIYQVLQTLRLDISKRRRLTPDAVSWTNLMRRIGWYLARPDRPQSLWDWLTDPKNELFLEKRGTRKRKPDKLDGQLGSALRKKPVEWTLPPPRTPRQGKPAPRKSNSQTIVAKITP